MGRSEIAWIDRGRPDCTGNTITSPSPDGRLLVTTCASCSLRWTMERERDPQEGLW